MNIRKDPLFRPHVPVGTWVVVWFVVKVILIFALCILALYGSVSLIRAIMAS